MKRKESSDMEFLDETRSSMVLPLPPSLLHPKNVDTLTGSSLAFSILIKVSKDITESLQKSPVSVVQAWLRRPRRHCGAHCPQLPRHSAARPGPVQLELRVEVRQRDFSFSDSQGESSACPSLLGFPAVG